METAVDIIKTVAELNNIGTVSILLLVSGSLGFSMYRLVLVEHKKILEYIEKISHAVEVQSTIYDRTTKSQAEITEKAFQLNRDYRIEVGHKLDVLANKMEQLLVCRLDDRKAS